MSIRETMNNRRIAVIKLQCVDLVFDSTGIRLIGSDDTNRIEAALIRGLNYADESARSVTSIVDSESANNVGVLSTVFVP